MSFYDVLKEYKNFDIDSFLKNQSKESILRSLDKEHLDILDYLTLISPNVDDNILEEMAKKSQTITHNQFGKSILIFDPLYISNFCVNNCVYCGFRTSNKVVRKILTKDEILSECYELKNKGVRHILLLTGESKEKTPPEYIAEITKLIKPLFSSISIEVYPMDEADYKTLVSAGIDGITIFQETYNESAYSTLHEGPKKNFLYRLETPERALNSKMRTVGIGALLGLYNPHYDSFMTALHAKYLMDNYTDAEVSISHPRIRPEVGGFKSHSTVDDKTFVKFILATRIFLPRVGITVSTREAPFMRDNLVGLGMTKMSAGAKTDVGGYTLEEKSDSQFEVSDNRDVNEISEMLYSKGYQPVFTDWQ